MSIFPLSILVAVGFFTTAIMYLKQNVNSYLDIVALLMVLGGTLSVGMMTLPWDLRKDLKLALQKLWKKTGPSYQSALEDCLATMKGQVPTATEGQLHRRILLDGVELLSLGVPTERLQKILEERVHQYGRRQKKVANSLRSLAKYPPAFGLMGTVLGLVNVMNGVSKGLSGKQTAFEMALALVATMYGLVLANLVLNPAGELIQKKASDEEDLGHMAVQTLMLMAQNTSLLEAQETLNSYAPEEQQLHLNSAGLET
ncbi:motility protein A [Bdellovibrio bacteriovorus]|uniref:motility protein A n=1 Tax=Bdellovibrio bacteriovorus TaxID=959 RepID=UPI0035A7024C